MAAPSNSPSGPLRAAEEVGRGTASAVDSVGFAAGLLGESIYWIFMGRVRSQPVRVGAIIGRMMDVGIGALPIITLLSAAIGGVLALQAIYLLTTFGAQEMVTVGVAKPITREFGPLITGIVVAGRSGSSMAARLGTMTISQEVDALRVMGINPVRYLVVPSLVAMVVMVPSLALWSNIVMMFGSGLYITSELGMTMGAFLDQTLLYTEVDDLTHGLTKSAIFGVLITLVGMVNGASVQGGAEGVGRVTTSAVVQSISVIILTDLIFVFAATR